MDNDVLTNFRHFYEQQKCSGTFMYIIDDCEPSYIKFTARITLKVTLDTNANSSTQFNGGNNRNEIELQGSNPCSKNTFTGPERCSGFDLMEELDGNEGNENEINFVTAENATQNPQFNTDIIPQKYEQVSDSPDSREETLHANEYDGQTVETECERPDFNENNSTSKLKNRLRRQNKEESEIRMNYTCDVGRTIDVDTLKQEESLSISVSPNITLKNVKGRLEAKQARIRPKHLRAQPCNDVTKIKVRRLEKKKSGMNLIANKCKQEIQCDIKVENTEKCSEPPDLEREKKGRKKKQRPGKLMESQSITCDYCEVIFSNKISFYDHRRNKGSEFECKICHKIEPFEAHLICHMQTHEPDKGLVDFDGKESNGKKANNKRKCSVCGLICSHIDSLKSHVMLHTKESPYQCCVCKDQAFSSLSSLRHHLETHKVSKRVQCKECKERFATRLELSKHRLTHDIKCELCGEVFPNKTSRTCHYRNAHPNEIKRCSKCWSLFPTDEELQKHMLYHRRNKKDQCPVCGLVVTKLKDHMAIHGTAAGEKLFACDQCSMKYSRKLSLTKHLRVHSGERPYACNLCPKRFRCNGMLRKHLLTHSLERPFSCEICGKKFSLRSNLVTHMRIHSELRKYPCSYCLQAFNYKTSLEIHLKCKHSAAIAPPVLSCVYCFQTFDNERSRKVHACVGHATETKSGESIIQEENIGNPKEQALLSGREKRLPEMPLQQMSMVEHPLLYDRLEQLPGKEKEYFSQRQDQSPSHKLDQHLSSIQQIGQQSEKIDRDGSSTERQEHILPHTHNRRYKHQTSGQEPTYIPQEPPMMPFFYSHQSHGNQQIFNSQFPFQNSSVPPPTPTFNLESRTTPFETAGNFCTPGASNVNIGSSSITPSSSNTILESHGFGGDRKYESSHQSSVITSILSAPPMMHYIPPSVEHLPQTHTHTHSVNYGGYTNTHTSPTALNKRPSETNGLNLNSNKQGDFPGEIASEGEC